MPIQPRAVVDRGASACNTATAQCGGEITVMTDAGSAADLEARNEYLIDIDEAWEACRDAVEWARSSYEEALESGRAIYEDQREQAGADHRQALDDAWAAYKQEVTGTTTINRRQVIADARAKYNASAGEIRQAYEQNLKAAHDDYARGLDDARIAYEAAVDSALTAHREAIQNVHRFLDGAEDGVDYLGLADELTAHSSVVESDATLEDGEVISGSFVPSLNGSGH